MIRPRTLAISPLITIATVAALLVGGSLYYRSASQPETIDCHRYAQQYELTANNFPTHFQGEFMWDTDVPANMQLVALDVEQINEHGAVLEATGRGTYSTNWRDIDFTFRIEANRDTNMFTMWESNPSVTDGFITQGRHVATFSNDVDHINARWVGDDGNHGALKLRTVGQSMRELLRAEHPAPAQLVIH